MEWTWSEQCAVGGIILGLAVLAVLGLWIWAGRRRENREWRAECRMWAEYEAGQLAASEAWWEAYYEQAGEDWLAQQLPAVGIAMTTPPLKAKKGEKRLQEPSMDIHGPVG